jgi:hypothetical protein
MTPVKRFEVKCSAATIFVVTALYLPMRVRRVEVARDTLKLQEERKMGKKLKKTEKLDLILSELAKLRGEIKKLVRVRAAVVEQGAKAKAKSAPRQSKKLRKGTGVEKNPDRDVAPSRPVLVQPPAVPQPTSGHGSTLAQSSRKPR